MPSVKFDGESLTSFKVSRITFRCNFCGHGAETVFGLQSLSQETFQRLVVAIELSRLDYCNGVLVGLPDSQLSRLQSVLHAAARLNHGVRRHDHVTQQLRSGVGSNLQVGGTMPAPSAGRNFSMCPLTFLLCPHTRGGTTIVCYRLRDN